MNASLSLLPNSSCFLTLEPETWKVLFPLILLCPSGTGAFIRDLHHSNLCRQRNLSTPLLGPLWISWQSALEEPCLLPWKAFEKRGAIHTGSSTEPRELDIVTGFLEARLLKAAQNKVWLPCFLVSGLWGRFPKRVGPVWTHWPAGVESTLAKKKKKGQS